MRALCVVGGGAVLFRCSALGLSALSAFCAWLLEPRTPVCIDVDVEALMRSTLDATREFDAFLVSLVHEAPPEAIALRQVRGSERGVSTKGESRVNVLSCGRAEETG